MFALIIFLALFNKYNALAVYSIDFGCEWIKMALVKPGIPMETVLMPDSSRKLRNLIGFKKDEIVIGDAALTYCLKKPKEVFPNVMELLAKNLYSNQVEEFRHKFPQIEMGSVHDRDAFDFIHLNETFLPEELIAFLFDRSKEIASQYAEQPVSGVVITVPAYFNQAERKAIQQAADISKLKLIQIMNDNAAVALNYGLFRQKMFNSTPHYVMFFDMGACSTQVSIVSYQNVQIKENTTTSIFPQLAIKGYGFDRTLGGASFQLRLRDHLASVFNQDKHATTADVTMDPKAMTKILVEAGRVMKILSANSEATAQVENVLEGLNLKIKVARTDFETLCEDLFQRVKKPIEDALAAAQEQNIHRADIEQIILFGGATRIPKVQDTLRTYTVNSDLGKGINTDEAAALGAVYQAAYLSEGFRAKKFIIKDANVYPIKVEFDKEIDKDVVTRHDPLSFDDDDVTKGRSGKKRISKLLFPRFNPCPQKKVITFNKNFDDFDFNVTYGDLDFLPGDEIKNFVSLNISRVMVKGVKSHLAKHGSDPKSEFKGIKAHFTLDENCIVKLDDIDIHYEYNGPKTEESTLSKIGNSIKNFFSSTKDDEKVEESDPNASPTSEVNANGEEEATNGEEKSEENKGTDDQKSKDSDSFTTSDNSSKTTDTADGHSGNLTKNGTENGSQQHPNQTHHIKESLAFEVVNLDFAPIPQKELTKCQKRLKNYKQKEIDRRELEETRNSLESFLIDTRDKLDSDEAFKTNASPQELEALSTKLGEVRDWFDEDGFGADKKELNSKLTELKGLIKPITKRMKEHERRAVAVDAMYQLLNYSENFFESAKNLTSSSTMPIFTDVEISKLNELITSTWQWFNETLAKQKETAQNVDPVLKSDDLVDKIQALEREVKYLQNKGRTEAMNQAKKMSEEMARKAKEEKARHNDTTTAGTASNATEADSSNGTTPVHGEVVKDRTAATADDITETQKNVDSQTEAPAKKETKKKAKGKKDKKKEPKEKRSKFDRDVIEDDLEFGNDVQKKTGHTTPQPEYPGDEL